jgi:hypothetical protein
MFNKTTFGFQLVRSIKGIVSTMNVTVEAVSTAAAYRKIESDFPGWKARII